MRSHSAYAAKSVPTGCALKTNFHTLTEQRAKIFIEINIKSRGNMCNAKEP